MRRRTWWGRPVMTIVALVCLASPALAADDEEEKPFSDVPVKEQGKPYIQWVVGALFAAGCLGIAFKNPARSHLD